jgi:ABC-type multidrug transport system fused ATPase/permease subunit
VLLYRNTRQIKRLSRAERRSEGALASTLHETLAAIRLVRVFNREDEARDRFREQSAESLDSGVAATMAGARFSWLVDVIRALILATILGFGVQRVLAGAMLPGELWVFFSYVRGFYRPMRTAMKQTGRITTATARAERVVELLDVKEGVADLPGARPAPRFRGEIEFRNVSFTYEAGKPVLDGIDLALPQGKVTAIVGPTGVGKTTLVSLIPRLYDPTEGAVLIDGEDIRRYTLRSVRAQMSMVLQESVLFRASIAENIAYGRHSASFDEIVAAARAANAHDFIMALPDGYETEIGERGETLSGGQRQRIAIARAMIRDAPILILDEPLVGLDGASAAAVLEALERLAAGRTAILISHQLSTVLRADHVVVLEDGRIAKQGPLRELLATDGLHRRLVTDQMTGVPEFRQVPSPRR